MKSLLIALVITMSMALAGSALAKGGGKHGLHGKVVSVSGSSVVIQTRGKDGKQTATVTTDGGTSVTIDGQPSKVSDLHEGLFVRITPENGTATMIAASTSRPHGHLGKRKHKNTTAPTTNPAGSVAG